MNIVRACPEDAGVLTCVTFAAKAHWGYPDAWMRRWRDALTITPDYVSAHPTYTALADGKIIGFYALKIALPDALLDHLWVVPEILGRGIGRALFSHAETIAREAGAIRIRIVGDPHAEGFYRRMGTTKYGEEPAPMDGQPRFLPLFAKVL